MIKYILIGLLIGAVLCIALLPNFYMLGKKDGKGKDMLTGLKGRESLLKVMQKWFDKQFPMEAFLISIDELDTVHSQYGYAVVDMLLVIVANYLEMATKKRAYRYSYYCFGVLVKQKGEPEAIDLISEICDRFKLPWNVDGKEIKLTVSISYIDAPKVAKSAEEMVNCLDYGLYYAKKNGKSQVVYCNDDTKNQVFREIDILQQIFNQIKERRVPVFYQPIYDRNTGEFNRLEALIRLNSNEGINPLEVLAIAQRAGVVNEIENIVMEQVCEDINTLDLEGYQFDSVAVNISTQRLGRGDFLDQVLDCLERHNVAPEKIKLEIVENSIAGSYGETLDIMEQFNEFGIGICLDDFGVGHSNLTDVIRLPFESVKIDRTLLWETEKNETCYNLVSNLVAIFSQNGTKVCASGIESQEQEEIAGNLFLEYIQGFYYSKPVPLSVAKQFLQRSK